MIRKSLRMTVVYVLEALALLLALIIIGAGAVMWRLSEGPVALDLFRNDAESALAEAFGGDVVELGALEARFDPDSALVMVAARDLTVSTEEGGVIVRAPLIEAGLALDALVIGRLSVVEARMDGGLISLVRRADGAVGAGIGGPESALANARLPRRPPPDIADLVVLLNDPALTDSPIGRLRGLQMDGAVIRIVDEVTGLDWRIDETRVTLDRDQESLQAQAAGRLATTAGFTTFDLNLESRRSMERLILQAAIDNISSRALAPARGDFAVLSAFDAPLSLDFAVSADREDGLRSARFRLEGGEGALRIGETESALRGGVIEARFNPRAGQLLLSEARIDSDAIRAEFSGRAFRPEQYVGALPTRWRYEATSPGGRLDLGGVFEAPPEWTLFESSGEIDFLARTIVFDWLNLDIGPAGVRLAGEAGIRQLEDGRWLPDLRFEGPVTGVLSPRDVLRYWPVELADGARDWIVDGIQAGRISNTRVRMDITAEALAERRLPNEQLEVSFDVTDGVVRYLPLMTPVTGAVGSGRLFGNAFEAELDAGQIGDIVLLEAEVDIPRLNPRGAPASFSGTGRGEVSDILGLIDQEPLVLPTRYGVDPETIGGRGEASFEIIRPMRTEVPVEDILFSIDGLFTGVSAPTGFGDLELIDAVVSLQANQDALLAEGSARLADAPVEIVWTESFDAAPDAPSTQFEVSATLDARTLDAFGMPVRRFLDGPVDLRAETSGRGFDFTSVDLDADFSGAALEAPGGAWLKPAGARGTAQFTLRLDAEDGIRVTDVHAEANGLELDARVRLHSDGRLAGARLDRLFVAGYAELSGAMTRSEDGGFDAWLQGPFLDARELISQIGAVQTEGAAQPGQTPLELDLSIDTLLVSDDDSFSNFTLYWDGVAAGVREFRLTGQGPSGGFEALFGAEEEGGERVFTLNAPSAGRLMALIGMADYAEGGEVRMLGAAPPLGEEGPLNARMEVRDLTLVRAPVLARILAAGSLEGVAALLNGEGIAFERIDGDFLWEDGLLTVGEMRAAGPSLGVTGSGTVDFAGQDTGIDGTIIPAYTLNSFLGGVPLIGDLLVSRPGEGVIGITYSVSGPFEETRVGANPVSALAPGFLRRIFEGTAADRAAETRERRIDDPLPDPVEVEEPVEPPAPEEDGEAEAEDPPR
jgi:hypothetical protein